MTTDAVYESKGALSFKKGQFILNGSPLPILSGAIHYFRVFPDLWRDRLLKLKACGLNTVETYVPWNLHEEYPGEFNFDGILNVTRYLELAHELGLYVIFRPGPFICSEWEFGGLPGWLLADPNMKVRSTYAGYQEAAERFFNKLIPMVTKYQYSNGGPIIAFQVENEFGSYSSDTQHLHFLRTLLLKLGVKELLLTSENDVGLTKAPFYKHALPTANFKELEKGLPMFELIRAWSADFPLMVMEFWTGWFDHWTGLHDGFSVPDYSRVLSAVLDAGSSFSLYMFHGGTNFGFMSGANVFEGAPYKPDVTSYDYDALLTEAGDVTPKYMETRRLILEKGLISQGAKSLPDIPPNSPKKAYASVMVEMFVSLENLLENIPAVQSERPVSMELLKVHGEHGQYYGYTLYRCEVPSGGKLLTLTNAPADRMQVFVNGREVGRISFKQPSTEFNLKDEFYDKSQPTNRLDLLVENHGRVNYALDGSNFLNEQRKGLIGAVFCDGKELTGWTIYPLEFKQNQVARYGETGDWRKLSGANNSIGLYRATLRIEDDTPKDTFIHMQGWSKGVVMVNSFNLGRYWEAGPQQTLYLPAPLLNKGDNQIIVFEQQSAGTQLTFRDTPILDETHPTVQ